MTQLNLNANLDAPDDFYAELLAVYDTLDDEGCDAYNARLLLIMANQIGENAVLSAAIQAARPDDG